jgi:hypothetical protein
MGNVLDRLNATQRERLAALNQKLIERVEALDGELTEQGKQAGLDDDLVGDEVTGWLQVALDNAYKLRYALTHPPVRLRDAADLFYRPSDSRVRVDRPDRRRGNRSYTATPASRKRVLSLMQDRFWPTLMDRTPNGFLVRTNRITQTAAAGDRLQPPRLGAAPPVYLNATTRGVSNRLEETRERYRRPHLRPGRSAGQAGRSPRPGPPGCPRHPAGRSRPRLHHPLAGDMHR